jgi:hypothetical protein
MLKQPARFVSLALLMFAASAAPLTARATQFDGPNPYPPVPPALTAAGTQFDGPNPYPPVPPALIAAGTQFDGPNPYPPVPPAIS